MHTTGFWTKLAGAGALAVMVMTGTPAAAQGWHVDYTGQAGVEAATFQLHHDRGFGHRGFNHRGVVIPDRRALRFDRRFDRPFGTRVHPGVRNLRFHAPHRLHGHRFGGLRFHRGH